MLRSINIPRLYKNICTVASFLLVTSFSMAQDGPQLPAPPKPAPAAQPTPAPAPAAPKPQPMPTVITGNGKLPPGAILVSDKPKPKPRPKPPVTATGLPGAPPTTIVPPASTTGGVAKPATAPMQGVPNNPFEVKSTATTNNATATTTSATPVAAKPDTAKKVVEKIPYKGDPNNPFDLLENATAIGKTIEGNTSTNGKTPSAMIGVDNSISKPETTPWENPFKKIFNRSDKEESHILLFGVLLSALIYLAFVMTVYQQQVSKIWGAFTNEQALAALYRERGGQMSFHYWVIYTLFAVSTGVFCYQVAHHFNVKMNSALVGLSLCMLGVALITFFRHTFLKIIAAIFPFFKEVNLYIFTITIFHLAMGLLLVPFVVFIAFAPDSMQTIALYAGLGLVGFIYILRSVRGLMIATKQILEYRFHFLLYLCAVEIAPMLILIKLGM